MQLYETAVVVDPQMKSEEIEEFLQKIKNFITNHGGEIVDTVEWGKRRLAYEIRKKQYGYYAFIRFNGPGQLIQLLEREYRLSENVLRSLTIKVDKRALKLEEMKKKQAKRQAEIDAENAEKEAPAPKAAPAAPEEKPTATEEADAPAESANEVKEEASE